jgi:hypothetical protein
MHEFLQSSQQRLQRDVKLLDTLKGGDCQAVLHPTIRLEDHGCRLAQGRAGDVVLPRTKGAGMYSGSGYFERQAFFC